MAVKLDKVVPFGRTLQEYIQTFSLTEVDLTLRYSGDGNKMLLLRT